MPCWRCGGTDEGRKGRGFGKDYGTYLKARLVESDLIFIGSNTKMILVTMTCLQTIEQYKKRNKSFNNKFSILEIKNQKASNALIRSQNVSIINLLLCIL